MHHLTLVPTPAAPPGLAGAEEGGAFTSRDLIALTCWMQGAEWHGYRRVLIECGASSTTPDDADYVLIYAPHSDWASWGIARAGDRLLVWHCGTGADLGRFDTMQRALDSLPPVQQPRPAMAPEPIHRTRRLTLVHSA